MTEFYRWFGNRKSERIGLVLMDIWKPFRNATKAHVLNATIMFDKFHIMRHLGEALDKARKSEYARLSGNKRINTAYLLKERCPGC